MGSIRMKLAALSGTAALLAVLAAMGVLFAIGVGERALERALDAQRRLDLLMEVSARLTDYGLAAVSGGNGEPGVAGHLQAARGRAEAALAAMEAALAEAARQESGVVSQTEMAARLRPLSRLRAEFFSLDRQITGDAPGRDAAGRADTVRGALNSFAAAAGPVVSLMVESERRSVVSARAAVERLSRQLRIGAVAASLLALVAAVVLYRALARPLLLRFADIEHAARAIGRGTLDIRLDIGPRDELGLIMARFNRMAARLAARERRVAHDRATLEGIVAQRTADLTAANDRLAAIDHSRRRFFADVSHELRTPLTVIIGECDVTQRAPHIPEALSRAALTTIRKRAQLLHRRVEDLLRLARSESGEIELDLRRVAVEPILRDACSTLDTLARRQGIALTVAVDDPAAAVQGDREWLRQVVEGLIENALRHATGATAISVIQETGEDAVRLIVADNGCGIAPELRPTLFQRFRRGAAADGPGKAPGFGLGLALAEWVVTRHGGRITLGSMDQQEVGARVIVTLPREVPDAAEDRARPAAATPR
ncbi:sensor histidine kinase [Azorhizobium doebereinerae]|uniref:sensor histidine kinase n=1 Tax=Azorhizobium doebereinerae TaxID=281091 RepID=UPI0003F80EEA|nr:HAMP domain-containing sensor histidine kinase [Azorhizobium doebereinerae]